MYAFVTREEDLEYEYFIIINEIWKIKILTIVYLFGLEIQNWQLCTIISFSITTNLETYMSWIFLILIYLYYAVI